MSLIVPPDDEKKTSSSTMLTHVQKVGRLREEVSAIVKRYDDEQVWDNIQSRDLPAEMINYVIDKLESGKDYTQIRKDLGILRSTDKSWKKIMGALKQGFRIDGPAHLMQIAFEYRSMSGKMREMIHEAFEKGVAIPTKDGFEIIKGPTKELAMMIDSYNRLNQGFIKNAKDLGAYVDQDGKGGGGAGGVTIQVFSNVALPSLKDVEAHHEKQKEKNEILLDQGRTLLRAEKNEPDQS